MDADDVVTVVRVVTGDVVANWDRTGTLTSKYQAARNDTSTGSQLVSRTDTSTFRSVLEPVTTIDPQALAAHSPEHPARRGEVLEISTLYQQLLPLVGATLPYLGADQERNRGAGLQRQVVTQLGIGRYGDHGQFPDVACQALEVKLQTARTVDLGLVTPDSPEPAEFAAPGLRHCDVRYAIFYATVDGQSLAITELVLTTGEDFFSEFRRFEGLVQNRKLQIPIPSSFFS